VEANRQAVKYRFIVSVTEPEAFNCVVTVAKSNQRRTLAAIS